MFNDKKYENYLVEKLEKMSNAMIPDIKENKKLYIEELSDEMIDCLKEGGILDYDIDKE